MFGNFYLGRLKVAKRGLVYDYYKWKQIERKLHENKLKKEGISYLEDYAFRIGILIFALIFLWAVA